MIVAITGATGFIGGALTDSLERDGHTVRRLTRSPRQARDHQFDPARSVLDPRALAGADAVVNLAGEPLGQRWTASIRRRIRESRVAGTRLVAETIASLEERPRVLVSGSAMGIYGDRGDEPLTERSPTGTDFLAELGRAWEAAAQPAADAGVRVVHPRMGLVLHRSGGALARLLLPFQLGVGGRIGSGRQWVSWISLDDAVAGLRRMIDDEALAGPVNLVGPAPVTNAEFTRVLAKVVRRPAFIPVPAVALRLVFRGMADATLLTSHRVLPETLLAAGFEFQHATVEDALRRAVKGEP